MRILDSKVTLRNVLLCALSVLLIAADTKATVNANIVQLNGTATVTGGLAGSQAVGGTAATNAAINQNPVLIAGEANSGQPAAATTGNQRQILLSLDGAPYVRPWGPVLWHCSLDAIAASLTQCQAVPGAGLSLYLTDIVIVGDTTTAGTYNLQTGTGANCVTSPTAVFPGNSTATKFTAPISTAQPFVFHFVTPIKLPANSELCLLGTATNTIHIDATGFTAP